MWINRQRLFSMGSVILLLAGLGWTVSSLHKLPSHRSHLGRRCKDLATLQNFEAVQQERLMAFDRVREQQSSKVVSLSTLVPGATMHLEQEQIEEIWQGWRRQEVVLQLKDIPVEGLLRLLKTLQPAGYWRLTGCEIKALPQPGLGQAELRLEKLVPPGEEST